MRERERERERRETIPCAVLYDSILHTNKWPYPTDDLLEDSSSRISDETLISSVELKPHEDFPPIHIRPSNQKQSTVSSSSSSTAPTPLPPSKKTSTTMKAATTKVANAKAKKKSATKLSPAKGGSSKAKKGFALPSRKDKKTRAKKKTTTQTGVESPSDADVLCGRGFAANNHKGNMQFRNYVMQLRCVYQEAQKGDKKALAEEVVSLVKADGGRFLRMSEGLWFEVADDVARKKASQAFREDKW